ncbi:hypothetical protein QTN25_005958 [Entamoeba marina]
MTENNNDKVVAQILKNLINSNEDDFTLEKGKLNKRYADLKKHNNNLHTKMKKYKKLEKTAFKSNFVNEQNDRIRKLKRLLVIFQNYMMDVENKQLRLNKLISKNGEFISKENTTEIIKELTNKRKLFFTTFNQLLTKENIVVFEKHLNDYK